MSNVSRLLAGAATLAFAIVGSAAEADQPILGIGAAGSAKTAGPLKAVPFPGSGSPTRKAEFHHSTAAKMFPQARIWPTPQRSASAATVNPMAVGSGTCTPIDRDFVVNGLPVRWNPPGSNVTVPVKLYVIRTAADLRTLQNAVGSVIPEIQGTHGKTVRNRPMINAWTKSNLAENSTKAGTNGKFSFATTTDINQADYLLVATDAEYAGFVESRTYALGNTNGTVFQEYFGVEVVDPSLTSDTRSADWAVGTVLRQGVGAHERNHGVWHDQDAPSTYDSPTYWGITNDISNWNNDRDYAGNFTQVMGDCEYWTANNRVN